MVLLQHAAQQKNLCRLPSQLALKRGFSLAQDKKQTLFQPKNDIPIKPQYQFSGTRMSATKQSPTVNARPNAYPHLSQNYKLKQYLQTPEGIAGNESTYKTGEFAGQTPKTPNTSASNVSFSNPKLVTADTTDPEPLSLFVKMTGISSKTMSQLCTISETGSEVYCNEQLFNNPRRFPMPMSETQASFNLLSPVQFSAHDQAVAKKKPFFVPNDHLHLSSSHIKLSIKTPDHILERIPWSERGIFGLPSAINSTSDSLFVFFNDPISAMLLFQKTNAPAISLPLRLEDPDQLKCLAYLIAASFSKVVLVCSCDATNHDYFSALEPIQQRLIILLQRWKCLILPTSKVASLSATKFWEALKLFLEKAGTDALSLLLNSSISIPSKNIAPTTSYLAQVRAEISLGNKVLWGLPLKWSLPQLTDIIKGLRPGELTVFTGPTGSGKTTILSLFSLDWCEQGVPTLWGSFEIPNHRIIRKMMIQRRGEPFSADTSAALKEFEKEAEGFSKLPLHFMNFFGSASPFSDVLEAMSWSVQNLSIKHIILDNLQFMISGQGMEKGSSPFTKFDYSDKVVAEIRRFATEMNCHVTLVIHPRKEQDNTVLGLCSVSGTAKATQEADTVLILQKIGINRYIDVRKNRFDGELGRIGYTFDPKSLRVGSYIAFNHRSEP